MPFIKTRTGWLNESLVARVEPEGADLICFDASGEAIAYADRTAFLANNVLPGMPTKARKNAG